VKRILLQIRGSWPIPFFRLGGFKFDLSPMKMGLNSPACLPGLKDSESKPERS